MATLYIAEFSKPATYSNGVIQVLQLPPLAQQTVVIGAGSLPSAAFNAATALIRVNTDAICSIAVGTAPTATTAMMRMVAGQTEVFGVSAGDKIAVIANT